MSNNNNITLHIAVLCDKIMQKKNLFVYFPASRLIKTKKRYIIEIKPAHMRSELLLHSSIILQYYIFGNYVEF